MVMTVVVEALRVILYNAAFSIIYFVSRDCEILYVVVHEVAKLFTISTAIIHKFCFKQHSCMKTTVRLIPI